VTGVQTCALPIYNHKVKPLTNKYLWQNRELLVFLCKEDYCVYLRDDTQSAALLAYHRPGGFHRLMNTSRYADWRTSSGFAQFRPEQSSVETAQSRRAVSGHCKKTNI